MSMIELEKGMPQSSKINRFESAFIACSARPRRRKARKPLVYCLFQGLSLFCQNERRGWLIFSIIKHTKHGLYGT